MFVRLICKLFGHRDKAIAVSSPAEQPQPAHFLQIFTGATTIVLYRCERCNAHRSIGYQGTWTLADFTGKTTTDELEKLYGAGK